MISSFRNRRGKEAIWLKKEEEEAQTVMSNSSLELGQPICWERQNRNQRQRWETPLPDANYQMSSDSSEVQDFKQKRQSDSHSGWKVECPKCNNRWCRGYIQPLYFIILFFIFYWKESRLIIFIFISTHGCNSLLFLVTVLPLELLS